MIQPIQILKNVKHNLSVPVVTEQTLTKSSELAEQYETKVRRLIYMNLSLFVPIMIGWKYWWQYRFGYSYEQSFDYIANHLKIYRRILMAMFILFAITILYFYVLHMAVEECTFKVYIQKKRKRFIRAYWLTIIIYLNTIASFLILFKIQILVMAAGITLCLVWIIKYVSVYLYKHYQYQFTYYQILIFAGGLNFIGLFFSRNMWLIANIIFIFTSILMLMGLFQRVSSMKEQFNDVDRYDEKDVEIEAYYMAYDITFWIMVLYAEISRLLYGNNDG